MIQLPEQPEDLFLLRRSRLYTLSRTLFLKGGGKFIPTVLTSARTLGSASLILNEIEYSPVASELEWAENDPIQRKDLRHADEIRTLITTVYHEQNHRILWNHFKTQKIYCPSTTREACRFLNLVESLVIALDMALGDELDHKTANRLYESRVLYNSGSIFMRRLGLKTRAYRNALQICVMATYLRLEGLHIEDIPSAIREIFSNQDAKVVKLCLERALRIEPRFVEVTNPIWQRRHAKKIIQAFGAPKSKKALGLPDRNPTDNTQIYLIAEKWFDLFKL